MSTKEKLPEHEYFLKVRKVITRIPDKELSAKEKLLFSLIEE